MQWLTYFLDLNSIDHVYDALCRRVLQISLPPQTAQELKIALKEDWDDIPYKDFPTA